MMFLGGLMMRLFVMGGIALSCLISFSLEWEPPKREHGNIQMGVPNDFCDNAQKNLEVDWDYNTDFEYKCQDEEDLIYKKKTTPLFSCLENQDIPPPLHQCMNVSIQYADQPPRGGSHRPLWPVYGEYLYVPPQRWIHSLEHGAVVFLYHPCADPVEVDNLRELARACLRRHIITPYRKLSRDQPFALVTYGCKLTMSYVNAEVAVQFIKENAMNPRRAPEYKVHRDGQYLFGLLDPAEIVPDSDIKDSNLCAGLNHYG